MNYKINEKLIDGYNIYFVENNEGEHFKKIGGFKVHTVFKDGVEAMVVVVDENSPRKTITLGNKIFHELNSRNFTEANLIFEDSIDYSTVLNIFEGFLHGEYSFDNYKEKKFEVHLLNITINHPDACKDDFKKRVGIIEGVNTTREVVNIPAIDMYPETLGKFAEEKLSSLGVNVKVLGRDEIEELGMKAFLAVAEGSDKEPKLIIMEYYPTDGDSIALVGKGLTYDSGGYAIKSAGRMVTMHCDMAGSGTVIGTIYALAKNKVQKNVIGIVAACENMISGRAYKNGDIISSMKGTFIEVGNTDAEGRLTLADAIYYAATKTSASTIIDIATLTGACVVALGEKTTGVLSNSDELYEKISNSSKEVGEYFWRLPDFDVLDELLESKRADIVNVTGSYGGAITAGQFLKRFNEDKTWAHLDIAGPAYTTKAFDYIPYGATGIPVKTLYNFLSR